MSNTPARPLWTVELTDRTLDQVLADRERISASLVSLENNATRRMLEATPLATASVGRWEVSRDAYRLLWEHFGGYCAVVDRAQEVRSRRSRPNAADLVELADLLGGDSVELPAEAVTTVQRSMTAAPVTRPARITVTAAVERMNRLYGEVTDVLHAAEAVWSQLLPRLDAIERDKRAAQTMAMEVDPVLAMLDGDLAEVRHALVDDPLSGNVQTGRLDLLEQAVADAVAGMRRAVAVLNDFAGRSEAIERLLLELERVERGAVTTRDHVVSRICAVDIPPATQAAAGLRQRFAALGVLHAGKSWHRLAREVGEVEVDISVALDRARDVAGRITAPLRLRDELRGRLDAYRGKAYQTGRAEDATLAGLYERAKHLLWNAPCPIGEAPRSRCESRVTGHENWRSASCWTPRSGWRRSPWASSRGHCCPPTCSPPRWIGWPARTRWQVRPAHTCWAPP